MCVYPQRWGVHTVFGIRIFNVDTFSRDECKLIWDTLPKATKDRLYISSPYNDKNWKVKYSADTFTRQLRQLRYNVYALLRIARKSEERCT